MTNLSVERVLRSLGENREKVRTMIVLYETTDGQISMETSDLEFKDAAALMEMGRWLHDRKLLEYFRSRGISI